MANTRFEEWWTLHHSNQSEAVKAVALAAFEAGMETADALHRRISDYLEDHFDLESQPDQQRIA